MAETGTQNSCIQVDVESILENKAPSLKKRLPGFAISYLKKIVHQDEVNYAFRTYGHLHGKEFADAIMSQFFNVTINIVGEENLPENGRVIFASNHPLGGIDGIALIQALGGKYNSLKIPVNDILLYIENLKEFFIPVNKIQGKGQSKNISQLLNQACESDAAVLFFPAGQCSRKQKDGSIRDNEWKKTFISKAKEYQRDIIPIHFIGANSKFFYNLAYYRSKFGIKANIEMLYLADEMFKQRNKTFTIIIGKPIAYTDLDNCKSDREWAETIKNISYELSNNP